MNPDSRAKYQSKTAKKKFFGPKTKIKTEEIKER